jgi:hypothetical protein
VSSSHLPSAFTSWSAVPADGAVRALFIARDVRRGPDIIPWMFLVFIRLGKLFSSLAVSKTKQNNMVYVSGYSHFS